MRALVPLLHCRSLLLGVAVTASIFSLLSCHPAVLLSSPKPINEKYDPGNPVSVKRASLEDWDDSKVFVGIAISGGGSRAANFSAAVLEELEKQGFMDHVTAVSSVSGGSITAAYYALNRTSPSWSWPDFYQKLREPLEDRPICPWAYCPRFSIWGFPHMAWMALTNSNRSELMADVFDDVFFERKTFGDLSKDGYKLLLNITPVYSADLSGATPFLEGYFREKLQSKLHTFPISKAVMASGAFPGAFPSITLANHHSPAVHIVNPLLFAQRLDALSRETSSDLHELIRSNFLCTMFIAKSKEVPKEQGHGLRTLGNECLGGLRWKLLEMTGSEDEVSRMMKTWFKPDVVRPTPVYEHLYDGGPIDNWGLQSLKMAAASFAQASSDWKGCFFFLIDAYPDMYDSYQKRFKPDLRDQLRDYVIDSNILDASDVFFAKDRKRMEDELYGERDQKSRFVRTTVSNRSCLVWHIKFSNFYRVLPNYGYVEVRSTGLLGAVPYAAPRIKTQYKLTGLENCSAEQHQKVLRAAAALLVNSDTTFTFSFLVDEARTWFESHGLPMKPRIYSNMEQYNDLQKLIVDPDSRGNFVYCE